MKSLRLPLDLPWDLLPGPLVFADVETTGVGETDRVVEVAAIRVEPGGGAVALESLVDHGERPVGAAFVHQITGEMLDGAPTFPELLPSLRALFEGATLVAHNAGFEERMLGGELRRAGGGWRVPRLCTLALARKAFPHRRGKGAHTLDAMVRLLRVPTFGAAHTAWADARLLPHLLERLLTRAGSAEVARQWVERSVAGARGRTRWPRLADVGEVRLKAR